MKKSNILFFLLCLPLFGLAQQDFVSTKFANYYRAVIQEKLVVVTDRPTYVQEEVIWFKIYALDVNSHKAIALSSVAYLELRNAGNATVLQAKITLKNGIGSGSFQLPKTMSSGKYHLLGYTNWMRNFEPSFFAKKEISIVGDEEQENIPKFPKYDIQLFPEGGNLVSGLRSKVGFKVVNSNNTGENLAGAVVNGRGDTLSRFSSTKYGMGAFEIIPSLDAKMAAVFKLPNGEVVKKDLPEIHASGIVMNVTRNGDGFIIVNATLKNYQTNQLSLIAHTRNQLAFSETKSAGNGSVSFRFSENELKEGISQLTIFDDLNKPICERLYFKKPYQLFPLTALFNQKTYGKREPVSLSVASKELANISVSIYKEDELNIASHENLYSYLWLASELKGKVEDADFYLNPAIDSKIEADNLMLTQGWRRFKWAEILRSDAYKFQYPPEPHGFIIQTQLNTSKTINTFATVLESSPKTLFAQTDETGSSSFLANFYGKKTLIFQTDSNQDSVSKFSLMNTQFPAEQPLQNHLSKSLAINKISSRYLDAQVQARFDKPIFKAEKEQDWNIHAVPNMVYVIDDYTKFPTIGETIREFIKGVSFRKKDNRQKIRISYKNSLNSLDYMTEEPLVLFDGIPTFSIDDILEYRAGNIERISVVQEKYHDNGINMGGVFNIKSKDKTLSQFKSPNALVVDYEGLQQERIFYSPKYSTADEKNTKLPDFRNLLYWNPSIQIFPDQQQDIKFYTSDRKGKYIGVIEGLAENGKATHNVITFEIL